MSENNDKYFNQQQNQTSGKDELSSVNRKSLILYNDEVNTFEFVIDTLVEICKHEKNQAEQCALIVHHKGKYCIKTGEISVLKPMLTALTDKGLNAIIE